MSKYATMRDAFHDELAKIAGEMQGFTRSGRKPIGVERLLERESESEVMPSDIAPSGTVEEEKTSGVVVGPVGALALLGGGALGHHQLLKAKKDWELGKAMRQQNGQ